MPRTNIEIVSSFSGTIEKGRFQNEKPLFSLKETWTELSDAEIRERQKVLEDMCYSRFIEVERRSLVEKIREQRKDIRFYARNGAQYPSVTSVIGWDQDMFVSAEALVQYGARGTILHRQVEIFLTTGEWGEPKDIPEVYAEYVIVTKGSLGLALDDVDFRGFYAKHPFHTYETEKILFNDAERYAGRCDIIAEVDKKLTIVDVKTGTTINKEKAFKQMAAYCKCMPVQPEQMMVVHLNGKTKQGFSAPIVSDKIEEHFQLFMKDRNAFRERFAI